MHSASVAITDPKRKKLSTFSVKDILGLDEADTRKETKNNDEEDINEQGKKTRQCFSTTQVEQLEKLFNEINYPDAYTRQMLAKKMKVSETRIQIWCQNRRAKIRRQRKLHQPLIPQSTDIHNINKFQNFPWHHYLHQTYLPFHHNTELACKSCSSDLPLYERRPELHFRNFGTNFTDHKKYFH
ncbi:retinal homeobox protein Rx-B [Hydra vulgaris]|uniref:Retinal homeobox protein Rx-B n=1 Tax=Hydra vulgaris TaxID=6087 RepID=A0ABM4CXD8_HYDVU